MPAPTSTDTARNTRPYRPANPAEDAAFYDANCRGCLHNSPTDFCTVRGEALVHDIDSPHYPVEMVCALDGTNPRCTKRADRTEERIRIENERIAKWNADMRAIAAKSKENARHV